MMERFAFMLIPCTSHKKRLVGTLAIAIIAAILILAAIFFRARPLMDLCAGTGTPSFQVKGYSDMLTPLDTTIEVVIPDAQITELLANTSVKKGPSFSALPSPCFEVRMFYPDGNAYLIVIGEDGSVAVAPIHSLEERSYWTDASGRLFDALYGHHLEAGGQKFE